MKDNFFIEDNNCQECISRRDSLFAISFKQFYNPLLKDFVFFSVKEALNMVRLEQKNLRNEISQTTFGQTRKHFKTHVYSLYFRHTPHTPFYKFAQ